MRAVRIHATGGPEVLRIDELETPTPGPGQVRVKLSAIGINFIDVYHRTGLYKLPLPAILGREGAGVVDAVGDDVRDFKVSDRVAFLLDAPSYTEFSIVPTARLIRVPSSASFELAAALVLQGLTAHYLCLSTYPLKPGEWTLVHAEAGATGQLVVQVAKLVGARVIGTVSTEEKARTARELGADEVINYAGEDFVSRVREITGGKGLNVVYDSVGRDTFEGSMNCLAPRGMLVLWGNASGAVPPIDPLTLMGKGSLYLTRPTLGHYIADRAELDQRTADLFQWVAEGKLKVRIDRTFPPGDAAEAHKYLESRRAMGKLLLAP
jgi:NADPH2:quinone reductase